MTKLQELYLKEVLNGNIDIEEVPLKLRDGVQEKIDKLNKNESGE